MEPTPNQNPLRPWAQRDDPNPLEIRKMCEQFQKGWTDAERRRRRYGGQDVDTAWEPPTCPNPDERAN